MTNEHEVNESVRALFAAPVTDHFRSLAETPPARSAAQERARWLFALALCRDGRDDAEGRAAELIPDGRLRADLSAFTAGEFAALFAAVWVALRIEGWRRSMIRFAQVADDFRIPIALVDELSALLDDEREHAPASARSGLADLIAAATAG